MTSRAKMRFILVVWSFAAAVWFLGNCTPERGCVWYSEMSLIGWASRECPVSRGFSAVYSCLRDRL